MIKEYNLETHSRAYVYIYMFQIQFVSIYHDDKFIYSFMMITKLSDKF